MARCESSRQWSSVPSGARAGRLTGEMFLNFALVGEADVGRQMSPTWSRAGSVRLVQVRSMDSTSSVPREGATSRGVSRVR